MGTKLNAGQFDCYANAEPDEPRFILLARDPLAPLLVEIWAQLRAEASQEDDSAMVEEARECADSMREWRAKRRPEKRLLLETVDAGRLAKKALAYLGDSAEHAIGTFAEDGSTHSDLIALARKVQASRESSIISPIEMPCEGGRVHSRA
ncbi:MAG: hypothetical protein AABN33_18250 [Acidobacteriota bacterium]